MSHTMSVYGVGPRTAILRSQLTATESQRSREREKNDYEHTFVVRREESKAVGTERSAGLPLTSLTRSRTRDDRAKGTRREEITAAG